MSLPNQGPNEMEFCPAFPGMEIGISPDEERGCINSGACPLLAQLALGRTVGELQEEYV